MGYTFRALSLFGAGLVWLSFASPAPAQNFGNLEVPAYYDPNWGYYNFNDQGFSGPGPGPGPGFGAPPNLRPLMPPPAPVPYFPGVNAPAGMIPYGPYFPPAMIPQAPAYQGPYGGEAAPTAPAQPEPAKATPMLPTPTPPESAPSLPPSPGAQQDAGLTLPPSTPAYPPPVLPPTGNGTAFEPNRLNAPTLLPAPPSSESAVPVKSAHETEPPLINPSPVPLLPGSGETDSGTKIETVEAPMVDTMPSVFCFPYGKCTFQMLGGYYASTGSTRYDTATTHLRFGKLCDFTGSCDGRHQGILEPILELNVGNVTSGFGSYYIGSALMLRYNFVKPDKKFVPYLQAGVGMQYNDAHQDPNQTALGQGLCYTANAQAGVRWFIKPCCSLDIEGGYLGISTLGASSRNDGINSFGGAAGLTFYFPTGRR